MAKRPSKRILSEAGSVLKKDRNKKAKSVAGSVLERGKKGNKK